MTQFRACGKDFANKCGFADAPIALNWSSRNAEIAAGEMRCDGTRQCREQTMPREDALDVDLWPHGCCPDEEDARHTPCCDLRAGQRMLYDLELNPFVSIGKPFHSVDFDVPHAALRTVADDFGTAHNDNLPYCFAPHECMNRNTGALEWPL